MKRYAQSTLFRIFICLSVMFPPISAQLAQAETRAANADAVFDVPALIATPLSPRVLKQTEQDGIVTEEVMFHSEMDGNKSVDIFAFFSYPKGARALPAFIWNQGGLGKASAQRTEMGARRGYATMCIDFPLPGYRSTGGYPINRGLELGDDPKQAPIYHGAVALLKAVSYLEARPEVDKDRIGMAGSSWGGFFTTLMAGIDPRLKAASAMFGTGGMHLGNVWWDGPHRREERDAELRERWRVSLDPAWRLPQSKVPIAWFSGTNDWFYWMPALMHSYARANAPKHLTLLPNWDHGLTPRLDEQVFIWLDTHLKDAPRFLQVTEIELVPQEEGVEARWEYSGPREVASADLILSYGDDGNWPRRAWSTLPARFENGVCKVTLPASSVPMYIGGNVTDVGGYRYSTPLLKVDHATFGASAQPKMLDVNGAALWSDFEEEGIKFLTGLAWPRPAISDDARSGRQAALLKSGQTTLAPFLITAGIPHRLAGHVKAKKPIVIQMEIDGYADKRKLNRAQEYSIGPQWTRITLDFQPPRAHVVELRAKFTVPEGEEAFLDDLTFSPVWDVK